MSRMYTTAAAVFVFDQVTKWLVLNVIGLPSVGSIEVLPPVLNLRLAWNYGVNFGLLAHDSTAARWTLITVALVIVIAVAFWMRNERRTVAHVSAGALIGGALGNVFDRIAYGAVADFLNMSCCGIRNPYSFNVADIAVFIGAAGLILFTGRDVKTP